jgi:hypothetical protein
MAGRRNPRRRRAGCHLPRISAKLWKAPLPFAIYQVVAPLELSALCSPVAQLVEQAAVNRWVAGSSPARGAKLPIDLAKNAGAVISLRATRGYYRATGACWKWVPAMLWRQGVIRRARGSA